MNGGLSQQARVLRLVDNRYATDLEAFNRATHPDALRELQLAPAEDLQASDDDTDAIGDPVALIRSIGARRLAVAAAFAVTVWCATAAFAVAFGGPN